MSTGSEKPSPYYLAFKRWWRRVRQARKNLQLKVARTLWDHRRSDEPFDPSKVKRVAVFRWDDKLGDSIMATQFVSAVHRARPDIEIVFITGKQGFSLLSSWDAISELFVCGRRGWKAAWSLRKVGGEFDVVVELTSGMSAYELFALRQLKGKHYLGYGKPDYRLFDLLVPEEAKNFKDRNLAAASIVVGGEAKGRFYVPESPAAQAVAREYFAGRDPDRPEVLINFFAAGKHRSFTVADAIALLQWWAGQWPEMRLNLLTVPGREASLDKIIGACEGVAVRRTPEPPTIELSAALAREADVIFSPDTAVVHIVAALDRPMIAVYRQKGDEFEAWRPGSDKVRVIFNRQVNDKHDRVRAADFSREELRESVDDLLGSRPVVMSDV